MPRITEQKHLQLTRIVEPCPHCKGPIFATEVQATENTWAHLAFRCDMCGTQWAHGGLVQTHNGFISDERAKYLSTPEEEPDEPEEVLVLARALKAAADYCSTPQYERDLYFHVQVAKTLLDRKQVLPTRSFSYDELPALRDYLHDLNYEHGIDRALVRTNMIGDQILHCTDPDGEWFIQLTGNPEDYADGADALDALSFPVHVILPAASK